MIDVLARLDLLENHQGSIDYSLARSRINSVELQNQPDTNQGNRPLLFSLFFVMQDFNRVTISTNIINGVKYYFIGAQPSSLSAQTSSARSDDIAIEAQVVLSMGSDDSVIGPKDPVIDIDELEALLSSIEKASHRDCEWIMDDRSSGRRGYYWGVCTSFHDVLRRSWPMHYLKHAATGVSSVSNGEAFRPPLSFPETDQGVLKDSCCYFSCRRLYV